MAWRGLDSLTFQHDIHAGEDRRAGATVELIVSHSAIESDLLDRHVRMAGSYAVSDQDFKLSLIKLGCEVL